jgi:hypothetical protein
LLGPKKTAKPDRTQLKATGPPVAVARFGRRSGCRLPYFGKYQKPQENRLQSAATGFLTLSCIIYNTAIKVRYMILSSFSLLTDDRSSHLGNASKPLQNFSWNAAFQTRSKSLFTAMCGGALPIACYIHPTNSAR